MGTVTNPIEVEAWTDAFKENLVKRVLRMGGIKPSKEDLPEDFPWWLKRYSGVAVDGLATEMGFDDSSTFIAAIQKDLRTYYRNQNGKIKPPQLVQEELSSGEDTDEDQVRTNPEEPDSLQPILIDIVGEKFHSTQLINRTVGVCSMCKRTGSGTTCLCGCPYTITVRIQGTRVLGIYVNLY